MGLNEKLFFFSGMLSSSKTLLMKSLLFPFFMGLKTNESSGRFIGLNANVLDRFIGLRAKLSRLPYRRKLSIRKAKLFFFIGRNAKLFLFIGRNAKLFLFMGRKEKLFRLPRSLAKDEEYGNNAFMSNKSSSCSSPSIFAESVPSYGINSTFSFSWTSSSFCTSFGEYGLLLTNLPSSSDCSNSPLF